MLSLCCSVAAKAEPVPSDLALRWNGGRRVDRSGVGGWGCTQMVENMVPGYFGGA